MSIKGQVHYLTLAIGHLDFKIKTCFSLFAQRNPVHMQECIHGPAVSLRLYIYKDYCYCIFAYMRTSDASTYLQIRKYACHAHGHAYLRIYRDQIHGPVYACSR